MTLSAALADREYPNCIGASPRTDGQTVPLVSQWPRHEVDEIAAVVAVLDSGRVNALVHGDENRAFEREFAQFIGMPHAIAVANGTVSLELALRALGVGPGDEVIVPARSFFASVSCVLAVGAEPVFADVELHSQNIDPASIARMVSPRTKAVICVHLAGRPCAMDALAEVTQTHGLFLIEDCAQAHGATWRGQRIGSFGAASSFSFCTDKIMSTGGEGGMVLFRDEAVWAAAFAYKDHGKNPLKLRASGTQAPGEFRYVHDSFGSNYRMTEMQAAIGRVQLAKLPAWLERRRANASRLAAGLAGIPGLIVDPEGEGEASAWYKYYARVDRERLPPGVSRATILAALLARGIPCGSGSCPDMSREGAFNGRHPRRDGELAAAKALGESTLMFPVDHHFELADMDSIALAVREVMS